MRIIHTADWHLCDRLGGIPRTADLQARVDRVAALCAEHAADVLLVAGDVFSEQASVDDMTKALTHLRQTFAGFFARGGTVLAVTGNHDRDARIDLVRAGMQLATPTTAAGGRLAPGRFYLVNGTIVGTLEARPGEAVQFVLVPFPFASRYGLPAESYRSKEEENRELLGRVRQWIGAAADRPGFDAALPTVLVAHLHVRGSELNRHACYKMTERDDVLFEVADLNPMWTYVALGHIHKPQALGGAETVRYSGSLDRLDFGETHDDHGVMLFDVANGRAENLTRLPIPATPFHTIALTDTDAELPGLGEKYPDRATAIVRVTAQPPAVGSRDDAARQIRKLFPRLHALTWADEAAATESAATPLTPRAGFAETVAGYLDTALAADPDKAAVLALAEHFLSAEAQRA